MRKFTDKIEIALNAFFDIFLKQKSESENDYQKWLESNPVIFEVLGIEKIIQQPILEYNNPEVEKKVNEKPDFLLKPIENEWIIFEIKTPFCKTTKNDEDSRRNHFYSEFNTYITQVKNYQDFFNSTENRIKTSKKYNENFPKNPKIIILAGLSVNTNRELARSLLPGDISLMTFDELIKRINFSLNNGINNLEYNIGITIILHIFIESTKEKGCIFEIGEKQNKNNISLWINKTNKLSFKVIDFNGDEIIIPVNDTSDIINKWVAITIDLKFSKKSSMLRVDIDGENKSFSECEIIDFELPYNKLHITLGCNIIGDYFSKFNFEGIFIYHKPISLGKKNGLIKILKDSIERNPDSYARFNKSVMHTSGHPSFEKTINDGAQMDLVSSKGFEPLITYKGETKKLVKLYSLFHKETVAVSTSAGIKFE